MDSLLARSTSKLSSQYQSKQQLQRLETLQIRRKGLPLFEAFPKWPLNNGCHWRARSHSGLKPVPNYGLALTRTRVRHNQHEVAKVVLVWQKASTKTNIPALRRDNLIVHSYLQLKPSHFSKCASRSIRPTHCLWDGDGTNGSATRLRSFASFTRSHLLMRWLGAERVYLKCEGRVITNLNI